MPSDDGQPITQPLYKEKEQPRRIQGKPSAKLEQFGIEGLGQDPRLHHCPSDDIFFVWNGLVPPCKRPVGSPGWQPGA